MLQFSVLAHQGPMAEHPPGGSPPPPSSPHLGDMDPAAFRRAGHELVDWIAGYLEEAERYPVLSRVKPGEGPRRPAPGRARRRRAVERHPRRRRAHRRPRPDPLEPPRVLRVLRDKRQRPRHPRRLPERRVQRPGHAVAHLAGGDRARRGGPGLAAAPARAAGRLRGGHLRHRLDLDPARAGRGPAGGGRRARARPRRPPRPPGAAHLLLRARPLVGRQGGDDPGAGPHRAAAHRHRRALPPAPRRPRRGRRGGPAERDDAAGGGGDGRHHRGHQRRSGAGHRRRLRRRGAVAARRRRLRGGGGHGARPTRTRWRGATAPTRWSSTPTSGCSSPST